MGRNEWNGLCTAEKDHRGQVSTTNRGNSKVIQLEGKEKEGVELDGNT